MLLNAFTSSLDGLIIGISLKLSNTKLNLTNYLIMFITNLLVYSTIITLYYEFHFKFMTTPITTILYLLLAINAFKTDINEQYEQKLAIKQTIILAIVHSLDGSILSLNFIYSYNILFIILLFSVLAIFLLIVGYFFANNFKKIKKGNYINTFLFIVLAILNLFL